MRNLQQIHVFRALARFCDCSLFFLAVGTVTLFLPFFYGPLFYYTLALLTPVLSAPLEALFLSKWGTTLGKALFGFSVRDPKGTLLSYSSALRWALHLPNRSAVLCQKAISWRRKLWGFAVSAAFVMAAVCGNVLSHWSVGLGKGITPDGWVQYSNDAGFKVSFPNDPEEASKELVIPDSGKVLNYQEITSDQSAKVRYSVSHLDLPRKWRLAANATILKGVLEQLVLHTPDAALIEKEFKTLGSHRVLDFRMKEGKNEVKGRLIIVSGTLYKLTISYPPSKSGEVMDNHFLDSFEVSS